MRRGPEQGKIYRLEGEEVRVGQGSKNDIIIHDNDVDRDHLQFIRTDEGYELHNIATDTAKTTFVNGQSVDGIWLLQTRCIIELGESITLEYRLGEPIDKHATEEVQYVSPAVQQTFLIVDVATQDDTVMYPLRGREIKVGRATDNDIVIVEPEMSRVHFRLVLTAEGYTIEDLGSTNGTIVNGTPISEPTLLYLGDIILVGTMIKMHLTDKPQKNAGLIETDKLIDPDRADDSSVTRKRKTSRAEIPGIIQRTQTTAPHLDSEMKIDRATLESHVLVTYAREDWERAVASLVDQLHQAEIETWVDQYMEEGSSDWQAATEQARLECWLLVVVVSPGAMRSEWVRRNWRHFQNREKPIILLVLEPVERLPMGAKKLTHIQYNPGIPEVAAQQLASEIKRLQSS